MKPILLNGGDSSSKVKASSKIEASGNNEAHPQTDNGVSANEIRRRRQAERDCGLQDMVKSLFFQVKKLIIKLINFNKNLL